MVRYAIRTLLQRPVASLLLFFCLLTLSFSIVFGALTAARLERTLRVAADAGPALVITPVRPAGSGKQSAVPDELRRVPGVTDVRPLPPDEAGNPRIGVFVYFDGEIYPALPDILNALPWPAQVVTKESLLSAAVGNASTRTLLGGWVLLPAALAAAYLFLGLALHPLSNRAEAGLLKALGWTAADLLRFFTIRATVLGLPSIVLGAVAAWIGAIGPLGAWVESVFLGFRSGPAAPPLTAEEGALALAIAVPVVGLIWMLGAIAPSLRAAAADPMDMPEEERC